MVFGFANLECGRYRDAVLPHGEQSGQGGGEVGEGCCGVGE